jgi:glycosyltransferase involved in cell wall biosynthesis
MRVLVTIPVYNEEQYVNRVLSKVRQFADDILVIDDGSTDQTPLLLSGQPVDVIRHAQNRGYGQCMIDAFRWSMCYRYDWLITMDCDEQHEPESLPDFYRMIESTDTDIVSGSRYFDPYAQCNEANAEPPADRQAVNSILTRIINKRLGFGITDAFCGFKAYRVASLSGLNLDETGYAFPLQFWVKAAAKRLKVTEIPVSLIYNDPNRSFGGKLDETEHRLRHYLDIFNDELAKFAPRFGDACCIECNVESLMAGIQGDDVACSHFPTS